MYLSLVDQRQWNWKTIIVSVFISINYFQLYAMYAIKQFCIKLLQNSKIKFQPYFSGCFCIELKETMVLLQTLLVFTSLKYEINNLWANFTFCIKSTLVTRLQWYLHFATCILCTIYTTGINFIRKWGEGRGKKISIV